MQHADPVTPVALAPSPLPPWVALSLPLQHARVACLSLLSAISLPIPGPGTPGTTVLPWYERRLLLQSSTHWQPRHDTVRCVRLCTIQPAGRLKW